LIVYHRTTPEASSLILDGGFRDETGHYLTLSLHRGVWVSDCPLDENEGANGDILLALIVPSGSLDRYEWIEEGKGYREFLVPAKVLNASGRPHIVEDRRWWERGLLP